MADAAEKIPTYQRSVWIVQYPTPSDQRITLNHLVKYLPASKPTECHTAFDGKEMHMFLHFGMKQTGSAVNSTLNRIFKEEFMASPPTSIAITSLPKDRTSEHTGSAQLLITYAKEKNHQLVLDGISTAFDAFTNARKPTKTTKSTEPSVAASSPRLTEIMEIEAEELADIPPDAKDIEIKALRATISQKEEANATYLQRIREMKLLHDAIIAQLKEDHHKELLAKRTETGYALANQNHEHVKLLIQRAANFKKIITLARQEHEQKIQEITQMEPYKSIEGFTEKIKNVEAENAELIRKNKELQEIHDAMKVSYDNGFEFFHKEYFQGLTREALGITTSQSEKIKALQAQLDEETDARTELEGIVAKFHQGEKKD